MQGPSNSVQNPTRPLDENAGRSAGYQVLYVQLPFELAERLTGQPRFTVLPSIQSAARGLFQGKLRFHRAYDVVARVVCS